MFGNDVNLEHRYYEVSNYQSIYFKNNYLLNYKEVATHYSIKIPDTLGLK